MDYKFENIVQWWNDITTYKLSIPEYEDWKGAMISKLTIIEETKKKISLSD